MLSTPDSTSPPGDGSDASEAMVFLTNLFGDDLLTRLRQNPNLHLPYADADLTTPAWFERAAFTVLAPDDLVRLSDRIRQQTIEQNRSLLQEIEQLYWQQTEAQQQHQQQLLAEQQRTAEAEQHLKQAKTDLDRLRKDMTALIRPDELVEQLFEDVPASLHILLRETTQPPTPDGARWLGGFARGWARLQRIVAQPATDEQTRLEQLHGGLTQLLGAVSGLYVPQRRAILEQLADWASAQFTEFDFVSPEETRQVDPAIHNAWGLGSATIREGVSFAVLRRQSRVAVLYADVRVQ